jgi:hypothetical protein
MSPATVGTEATAAAEQLARLVAVLDACPGSTSREIAEHMALSRRHTTLLLLRLEALGHVIHEGRGWYAAPDLVCEHVARRGGCKESCTKQDSG